MTNKNKLTAAERKAIEAAEREAFYKSLGKKPGAAAAGDAPVAASPEVLVPVLQPAPAAAPADTLAGRIFVRGAVSAVDRNESKSVLLRIPEPMLKALDSHIIGDRTGILLAMIGNAIDQLEKGAQIEFDAVTANRWIDQR